MANHNLNNSRMPAERLVAPAKHVLDEQEHTLRPQLFSEFTGQSKAVANLQVFVEAARQRGRAIDHVLLYGPPGLGKTTLAQIIAREMGVNFRATVGPIISKAGDLAALLTNLQANDVLFIDEIHRLNPAVEEVLYSAMEDGQLDLMIGEGPAARSIRIDLPPFTLIGATTRAGLLSQPLLHRFGIPVQLDFYTPAELVIIIKRAAHIISLELTEGACNEIAKRGRGTTRIVLRLLRRLKDFADVAGHQVVDQDLADKILWRLEVDQRGLDKMDRRYLQAIAEFYEGGPVGVETMAAVLSEQRDTIEEVIEPYLIQQGLLKRTSRGRMLTLEAREYLSNLAAAHRT